MKLYKIGKTYCYDHRTCGWLVYRKGDWCLSLTLMSHTGSEIISLYPNIKKATPAQFKKSTSKDVRRTIKTYAQRWRRAQQRLKELLNGTRIIKDDTKLFCGGKN